LLSCEQLRSCNVSARKQQAANDGCATERRAKRVCASHVRHAWHRDVTVSEAGVVKTSHVAAAVLMIHLAVILHSNKHVVFFSRVAFETTKW